MSDPEHNSWTPVAIIGAGPYGLSLAAHLAEAGLPFRIFGRPMQSWKTQMPAGMKLKSDGFASNLFAGSQSYTLEDFCRERGRPYHPTEIPVAVEDFAEYGEEFARRFVPGLEERNVVTLERERERFRLVLKDEDSLRAKNVVIATGVSLYQHVPEILAHLPAGMVTHTAEHRTFERFAGQDVAVLGRGASSLNAAALLNECGARVTLVSRQPKIHIHAKASSRERTLLEQLRWPMSPLGYSKRSWLAVKLPLAYRAMPGPVRRAISYKHLGPSGGYALQGRIEGKFPILRGWTVKRAEMVETRDAVDRRVRLLLQSPEGEVRELSVAHVLAGTGFRVDLSRLPFLAEEVRVAIQREHGGAPRLGWSFESSVRGLYFAGPAGAASFGPLMKFAAGAEFAAQRITRSLLREVQ